MRRRITSALALPIALAGLSPQAGATVYGMLSNFDVVNDTGFTA